MAAEPTRIPGRAVPPAFRCDVDESGGVRDSLYRLTASREGESETITVYGQDQMDAVFGAIKEILDRAYAHKTGVWAKGRIELHGPEGLIAVMDEKLE